MNARCKLPLIATLVVAFAAFGLLETPAEGISTDEYGYTTIQCYECDAKTDDQCLQQNPAAITNCSRGIPGPSSCIAWMLSGASPGTSHLNEGSKGCLDFLDMCFSMHVGFQPVAGKCLKRRVGADGYYDFTKCVREGPPVEEPKRRNDEETASPREYGKIDIAICSCSDKDLCNVQDVENLKSAELAPEPKKGTSRSVSNAGPILTLVLLAVSLSTVKASTKPALIMTLLVFASAVGLLATPAEGISTDEHGYTTIECYKCDSKTDDQCLLEKNPNLTTSCQDGLPGPTNCVAWMINGTTDATFQFNQGSKGCRGYLKYCFPYYAEFEPVAGKCLKRRMTEEAYHEFISCEQVGPPVDSGGRQSPRSDNVNDTDMGTGGIEITICSCMDKDLCNDQDLEDLQAAEWAPKWIPEPVTGGCQHFFGCDNDETTTATTTASASKKGCMWTFLLLIVINCAGLQF